MFEKRVIQPSLGIIRIPLVIIYGWYLIGFHMYTKIFKINLLNDSLCLRSHYTHGPIRK